MKDEKMRAAQAMTAAALLALLATGCSSGTDTGENKPGGWLGGGAAPAAPTKLSVPPAFDASKGWDEVLSWVPQGLGSMPVTVVPRSQAVAFMQAAPNGYTISMRSADGKLVWRSAPWAGLTPVAGVTGSRGPAEIPDLKGVEIEGRSYVVAYAHGLRGKDQLHDGAEIVRLAIFPANAKGESVKPLREIDVPVSADPGEIRVQATGGRLLVAWGQEGYFPDRSATVNVTSGEVAVHDSRRLLEQCRTPLCSSRVVAATADGPLVAMARGGFGMPGRYFSENLTPEGIDPKSGFLGDRNGSVYGAEAGHALISWRAGKVGDTPVWAIHDLRTGAPQARLVCGQEVAPSEDATRDYPVVSSPGGQYLAAGSVIFDVKNKRGICLHGDGNRKTIAVLSIQDNGTAYGVTQETSAGGTSVLAQVDLRTATGDAKPLEMGTEVPLAHTEDGTGVFLTRNEDKSLRLSVRRPARR
ncbi:hypothetical protein [Streptomyces sp. C]|uniref:hypothetical protein n=1 Tax=Streptomyces sp. C TaxID=253839 RepID=UPI0001DEFBAA|nr:hypothetical protein [Streptomyces sp. C]EFL19954.1 conserved hypothetical protein [Streptomyces sp. C]